MTIELVLNWSRGRGPSAAAVSGDALSELLGQLRVTSWVSGPCELRSPFAISFPAAPASLFAMTSGRLLIRRDPHADSVEVMAGDVAIVIGGTTTVVCDDVRTPVRALDEVLSREQIRARVPIRLGSGPHGASFVGAAIRFDPLTPRGLLASLPPVVVARSASSEPSALADAVRLLHERASAPVLGNHAFLNCLVSTIMVEAIRIHLTDVPPTAGVLRAAADDRIGPVVALLHSEMSRPWNLQQLAFEAGLSRSTFCERFRALLGETPASYLRNMRMNHTARLLETTDLDISGIASRVGYGSEGALCTAFKKWSGQSPGEYRLHRRASHGLRPNDAPPPTSVDHAV